MELVVYGNVKKLTLYGSGEKLGFVMHGGHKQSCSLTRVSVEESFHCS